MLDDDSREHTYDFGAVHHEVARVELREGQVAAVLLFSLLQRPAPRKCRLVDTVRDECDWGINEADRESHSQRSGGKLDAENNLITWRARGSILSTHSDWMTSLSYLRIIELYISVIFVIAKHLITLSPEGRLSLLEYRIFG
uniref:Uncharacterized protein n=1 Tax=Ascaris lumbricoides TaxID=6252 RepID=A0A9J2Q9B2_ASCLU